MGTGTSTRRSMTWTAARPDVAARACSQARCRQEAEHHLGMRPRALGSIAVPHHPHVVAARLRSLPSTGAGAVPEPVTAATG